MLWGTRLASKRSSRKNMGNRLERTSLLMRDWRKYIKIENSPYSERKPKIYIENLAQSLLQDRTTGRSQVHTRLKSGWRHSRHSLATLFTRNFREHSSTSTKLVNPDALLTFCLLKIWSLSSFRIDCARLESLKWRWSPSESVSKQAARLPKRGR